MNNLVEHVARAIVARRNLPKDAEINWQAFRADAHAAIAATQDWVDDRYGCGHPAVICLKAHNHCP